MYIFNPCFRYHDVYFDFNEGKGLQDHKIIGKGYFLSNFLMLRKAEDRLYENDIDTLIHTLL